jgi:hypothetical protein
MIRQPVLNLYLERGIRMPCGLARDILYPIHQQPMQLGYSHGCRGCRSNLFVLPAVMVNVNQHLRDSLDRHLGRIASSLFHFLKPCHNLGRPYQPTGIGVGVCNIIHNITSLYEGLALRQPHDDILTEQFLPRIQPCHHCRQAMPHTPQKPALQTRQQKRLADTYQP